MRIPSHNVTFLSTEKYKIHKTFVTDMAGL